MKLKVLFFLLWVLISQGQAQNPLKAITQAEIKAILVKEIKPNCESAYPKNQWVYINEFVLVDLTGDGVLEALVTASTCTTGTAGADILRVYAKNKTKGIHELKIDEPKEFNGKEIWSGHGGGFYYTTRNNTLIGVYIPYGPGGKTSLLGIERELRYQWDAQRRMFVLTGVQDKPM
ncbi:MAG TPA: hypothetical protein VEA59_00385 [Patescibacteria group bacterium]|nr:hypothetical protein [Patescibacteria group bacterium]